MNDIQVDGKIQDMNRLLLLMAEASDEMNSFSALERLTPDDFKRVDALLKMSEEALRQIGAIF